MAVMSVGGARVPHENSHCWWILTSAAQIPFLFPMSLGWIPFTIGFLAKVTKKAWRRTWTRPKPWLQKLQVLVEIDHKMGKPHFIHHPQNQHFYGCSKTSKPRCPGQSRQDSSQHSSGATALGASRRDWTEWTLGEKFIYTVILLG